MSLKLHKWPKYLWNFNRSIKKPAKFQKKKLEEILTLNKDTEYGLEYDFANILAAKDIVKAYQKAVPVIEYEDIEPLIVRMMNGERNIISARDPIFYARSSGYNSNKFIPRSESYIEQFDQKLAITAKKKPGNMLTLYLGDTAYMATQAVIGHTNDGTPHGNISGRLAQMQSPLIQKRMVLPAEVYAIKDANERLKEYSIRFLSSRKIRHLAFTYPTEVFELNKYIDKNWDELINIISKKNPKKGKRLQRQNGFDPKELYQHVKIVSCITAGQEKQLIKLQDIIGHEVEIRTPGVLSSEGDQTISFFSDGTEGIVSSFLNFFEFKEIKNEDEYGDKYLTINQLKKGTKYVMYITTEDGLYRYNMRDIFMPVEKYKNTWKVKYMGRDKFLDIAGEHSPYHKLEKAMNEARAELEIEETSYTLIPDFNGDIPRYNILFELNPENTGKEIKLLNAIHDKCLQMETYNKSINNFKPQRFETPIITTLETGSYNAFMLRHNIGQRKAKQIINDPDFIKEFKIKESYDLNGEIINLKINDK